MEDHVSRVMSGAGDTRRLSRGDRAASALLTACLAANRAWSARSSACPAPGDASVPDRFVPTSTTVHVVPVARKVETVRVSAALRRSDREQAVMVCRGWQTASVIASQDVPADLPLAAKVPFGDLPVDASAVVADLVFAGRDVRAG